MGGINIVCSVSHNVLHALVDQHNKSRSTLLAPVLARSAHKQQLTLKGRIREALTKEERAEDYCRHCALHLGTSLPLRRSLGPFGPEMPKKSRKDLPLYRERKISPKFFRPKFFHGRPRGMSVPKCSFSRIWRA